MFVHHGDIDSAARRAVWWRTTLLARRFVLRGFRPRHHSPTRNTLMMIGERLLDQHTLMMIGERLLDHQHLPHDARCLQRAKMAYLRRWDLSSAMRWLDSTKSVVFGRTPSRDPRRYQMCVFGSSGLRYGYDLTKTETNCIYSYVKTKFGSVWTVLVTSIFLRTLPKTQTIPKMVEKQVGLYQFGN